nr:hypothetical protein Iba_chr09aCG6070 [Ipomoea batatas]GMD33656.1 hypothetical protein Iba_chr09cCG4670 [Ipomoea batatas]GMD35389.1 hypothetical protein Iba_chr09dCG6490 [Ipomoea batatas]
MIPATTTTSTPFPIIRLTSNLMARTDSSTTPPVVSPTAVSSSISLLNMQSCHCPLLTCNQMLTIVVELILPLEEEGFFLPPTRVWLSILEHN